MTKKIDLGTVIFVNTTLLLHIVFCCWFSSSFFTGWEVMIPILRSAWPMMDVKCIVLILLLNQLIFWRVSVFGITACPSTGGTPIQLLLPKNHIGTPENWEPFWMNLGITRSDFSFDFIVKVNKLMSFFFLMQTKDWIVEGPVLTLLITYHYL